MILSLLISPPLLAQQNTDTGWKVINKDVYKKDTSGKVVIGNVINATEKLNVGGDVRIDGLKGVGNRIVYADQEGKLKTDHGGGPPDWWRPPDGLGGNSGDGAGNGMSGLGGIMGSCIWQETHPNLLNTECKVGIGLGISSPISTFTIKGKTIKGAVFEKYFTITDINNNFIFDIMSLDNGTAVAVMSGNMVVDNSLSVKGSLSVNGNITHFCTGPNDCFIRSDGTWFGGFNLEGGAHFKSSYGNFDLVLESNNEKAWDLAVGTSGDFALYHPVSKTAPFRVKENGNVCIGTSSSDYKLNVCGTIRTKEVIVDASSWCDFVFDKNYSLMSIPSFAKFISENKHLPGMPSAKEVMEKGVNLGEMQTKLLQKMEEFSLYIIQQDKKIEELEIQTGRNNSFSPVSNISITIICITLLLCVGIIFKWGK